MINFNIPPFTGNEMDYIKEAVDAGFTDVILTSHYIPQGYETDAKELTIWREKLQDAITKENISLFLLVGLIIQLVIIFKSINKT